MSLEISQETQARLADEARKEGVSIDALLQRLIDEHKGSLRSAGVTPSRRPAGRKSLAQLFADSPFKGLDIDFERDPDYGRDLTL
jgi:hypothetical protein